ncbi:ATP-dependent RNA helicase [Coelomomyces lativittatus]|nr:ATP-dependent RNA helicase [Coelomomyces lativittatus]
MHNFFRIKKRRITSPSSTTTTTTPLTSIGEEAKENDSTSLQPSLLLGPTTYHPLLSSDEGSETETEGKQKKKRKLSKPTKPVLDLSVSLKKQRKYVVCGRKQKLSLLVQLIKRHYKTKKILVLFSSSQSAEYHTALVEHLKITRPHIYITENTEESSNVLSQLQATSSAGGVLFSLNQFDPVVFSSVTFDYVYYYELCPCNEPLIHVLPSLLSLYFIYPHELSLLSSFQPPSLTYHQKNNGLEVTDLDVKEDGGSPLTPMTFSLGHLMPLDHKIEEKNKKNYFIYRLAWLAYRTTLPIYAQRYRREPSLSSHVHDLPNWIASAFGFSVPPRVKY